MEMNEILRTPRGNFRVRFKNMEEAEKAGFTLWFVHEDYNNPDMDRPQYAVVANGSSAYSVMELYNASLLRALGKLPK